MGPPPSPDEQREVWALLDGKRFDRAGSRILELIARDPEAPWPRFALGALYFRRLWRRDCLGQWEIALARDPAIVRDPRFAAALCHMLDPKWEQAGIATFLTRLGPPIEPLVAACLGSAPTPAERASAARVLERLREGRAR